MKSLRITMWKSAPVILGVFLILVTMGCDDADPQPVDQSISTFSGVQTVLVTNASGTLVDTDLEITATVSSQDNGEIAINLIKQINGNAKEYRLEGKISSNNIRVRQVNNSANSTEESDGEISFEEFFGLGTFSLQDDCPDWYGTLKDGQLDISCNFCCNAAGMQDTANGKVTCSLDQM